MESVEEFTGSTDQRQIVKGKRTKRQRPSSPLSTTMSSSLSTADGGGGGAGGVGGAGVEYFSTASPATSCDVSVTTIDEEEDMANCLILLAQGARPQNSDAGNKTEKTISSRKLSEMATTTTTKAGFYVYECKTCNRTFPSFQALGGHRASHKKPKPISVDQDLKKDEINGDLDEGQFPKSAMQRNNNNNNNKSRMHECSICGSEFSSGQALGGHMRRHRTTTASTSAQFEDDSKPRNILPLDLNLPAPEDDQKDSKFQFVFSSTALVDCHY